MALIALSWLRYRHVRGFARVVSAVVALRAVQITLGQITVQYKLSGDIVMAHLANAELLLGVLIWTVLRIFPTDPAPRGSAVAGAAEHRAALAMTLAAAATFVLVLSGAFVVANGAGYACDGWPLCGGGFHLDSGQLAAYNLAHRGIAAVAGVLLVCGVIASVRRYREQPGVRPAAWVVSGLLLVQVAAGALVVELRLPAAMRSLHEALASALWATTVLLALLVVSAARSAPATATSRAPARAGSVR